MQMIWSRRVRLAIGACLAAGMLALASIKTAPYVIDQWPDVPNNRQWAEDLFDRLEGPAGRHHDMSYVAYMGPHTPFGDYLHYGVWKEFRTEADVRLDEQGLPTIIENGEPYYNPVTLSQYALTMHGRLVNGHPDWRDEFDRAIDKLIELQPESGGWPYPSMSSVDYVLPEGWVSAMAQGQALSALARSLHLRDNPTVRAAAEKAFENLTTPVEQGGGRTSLAAFHWSLADWVFFSEYPTIPEYYTLNGYMFTLLGLYDWAQIPSKNQAAAKRYFAQGMLTLKQLLPYYDIDGLSTYDLAHLVAENRIPSVHSSYLGVHVYLLSALSSIDQSPKISGTLDHWNARLERMNALLKFTSVETDMPSPQSPGTSILLTSATAGGNQSSKLYRYSVKKGEEWTVLQEWSPAEAIVWTPVEPGEYIIGFAVKSAESTAEYDNYRNHTFVVE